MEVLNELSNNKYLISDIKINEGAYSKVYDVVNKKDKCNQYIVKVQKKSDRHVAINEIKFLEKLKKNKQQYFDSVIKYYKDTNIDITTDFYKEYLYTSKVIDIEDYYYNNDYIFIIFKKYNYTLEDFNIRYNQEFNEVLPLSLIKKITNSLFLGSYELQVSNLIHCDIKPDNILITTKNKSLSQLFKDIKRKKLKKTDLINYIDILYIDFNLSQKSNAICKSTSIQTTYYMSPEIILGNSDFNYSIDYWSIGCIIYELFTGHYLFDIYGWNKKYGKHFENYSIKEDNNTSESCNSYSYYNDNTVDNIILLHYYRELFGDNTIILGNNINKYYINNALLGTVENIADIDITQNQDLTKFLNHIKNNILYKIDDNFYNYIIKLFQRIYIYNYSYRLTTDEYFKNFIINIT